ncbi:CHAT domain-containing protein [Plantactinospora veratri]
MAGAPVRVFISYAHQDSDHGELVRRLWLLLRSLGVDAKLDVTATAHRQFWPDWMSEQVREAAFVLVVASPAYRERGEDRGDRSTGRGVRWEARLLKERWYADPEAGLRSILPVVLPDGDVDGLPDWLVPVGGSVYHVPELTATGVEELLRVLTAQPQEVEPPVGTVPWLPPRSTAPATGPTAVPPVGTERVGLSTELLINARLADQRLTCEVSLAGTPVCRREAVLPVEVGRVWDSLTGPVVVARERFAEVGRVLAGVVFDELGQSVVADLVARLRPGDQVEVVWCADGAALGVPVELLRLTTTDGEQLGPLALIGGVSVRRLVRGVGAVGTAGLPGPLRVLAAVAAPEETRTANAALDVEAEMQALLDAVGGLVTGPGGQVRILEVASLAQITAALRETEFHVLHLSAHGSPSEVELEDEDGNPQPVGARELMNAIKDAGAAVPLIVLSSCAGAADDGDALATAMVAAGADRVLAMQASVTDGYATRLLAEFYRELASTSAGRVPSVGDALARARRGVERARRADDRLPRPEYAVATLLCAGADRPLIDTGRPEVDLTTVVVPSGTSVRELGLGQLIGRRSQLREATGVLRRTERARDRYGVISGVQVIGVGGIGKTALAGRLVTRLRGDGMLPVVHEGRWNPSAVFAGMAAVLEAARPGNPVAATLDSVEVPDTAKAALVAKVLGAVPVLLVFDDFEQNLSPGGAAFLDPAFDEVFSGWCEAAQAGAVLVTCRYPLPGDDRYLVPVPVGPLSPAELRRLLLRLPALRGLADDDLRLLTRTIGGHPRLIEYVDALLRGRPARFREVQAKLRRLADREGIDLRRPRPVGAAVEDALLLGGGDILLDELLGLLTEHEREVLGQLAVSRAPMSLDDLAYALAGPESAEAGSEAPVPLTQLAAEVERLGDLTLLAPGDEILVHPWTAELLGRRPDPDAARRHAHALRMRVRRLREGRHEYDDLIDIVRHLAAIGQYDDIPELAQGVVTALPGVLAAAAYLAEIRPLIPRTEPAWAQVVKQEFEAVRAAGDLTSARTLLYDIRQAVEQRLATNPGDEQATADLSVLLVDLGDLAITTADLETARGHYQSALDLGAALSADVYNNPWWRNRPALIRDRLGTIARAAGDLTTAHQHYQASLDIAQRLTATDPSNTRWQRDLSASHDRLGDIAIAAGDLTTARQHYQASLDLTKRLAAADPSNTEWQRDLSISHNKLGDVAGSAGDLTTARQHYQASLDIRQRLTTTDPSNSQWQRDLSISHNRLGDVARGTGDLTTAHQHYQASLAITQRLTATDPSNTEWQRDLSISHDRCGDVAVAAGDLTTARQHYQASLNIRQRLTTTDPSNTEWQRDLSISHNKLGDVAVAADDLTTARQHYQASLDIAHRLTATDPSNTGWQRDLSISHNRLGDIARGTDDLTTARQQYQASLDITQRLAAADPSNTGWQRDLSISHNRLGDIARGTDDLTTARRHYQASLDIRQRLTTTDPSNSQWQRDLVETAAKLADLETENREL